MQVQVGAKIQNPNSEKGRTTPTHAASPISSPSRRLMAHERDGFCIAVDSYDGQNIYVDGAEVYEISTYLGGGVAGVVYEGRRLVSLQKINRNKTEDSPLSEKIAYYTIVTIATENSLIEPPTCVE